MRFATLVALLPLAAAQGAPQPHIVTIVVDDYGFNQIGYHAKNQPNSAEIVTPVMDQLAADGIIIDQHYAFQFCSPSRSAFQTGRNPIHVNVLNDPYGDHNPADPISGFQGIPRNMSTIAEKLASVGYRTLGAGKWHLGLATPDHLPAGRGYNRSLFYLDGANDYWTNQLGGGSFCTSPRAFTDLWLDHGPAFGQNNSWACSQSNQLASCVYEDDLFTQFAIDEINAHDPSQPLFLYFAPHSVHEPLEVPAAQLAKFDFINETTRRSYSAMVNYIDQKIGTLVATLQQKGMWNNTLLLLTADNGGPIYCSGQDYGCKDSNGVSAGGNNHPLRGGKVSNWQGGVRVNAFVSGGFVPQSRRGSVETSLIGIEDWYASFCALAGADPVDHKAAAAGLPPIDSLNIWPLLSGQNTTSPRTEVVLGSSSVFPPVASGSTVVQSVIRSDGWKLLVGLVGENVYTGPFYPNASTNWVGTPLDCGNVTLPLCLFNIFDDPTEHNNMIDQEPDIAAQLAQRIVELQQTVFSPDRGNVTNASCIASETTWKGFVGPFLP
jgi:arylsulfatase B